MTNSKSELELSSKVLISSTCNGNFIEENERYHKWTLSMARNNSYFGGFYSKIINTGRWWSQKITFGRLGRDFLKITNASSVTIVDL